VGSFENPFLLIKNIFCIPPYSYCFITREVPSYAYLAYAFLFPQKKSHEQIPKKKPLKNHPENPSKIDKRKMSLPELGCIFEFCTAGNLQGAEIKFSFAEKKRTNSIELARRAEFHPR